MCLQMVPSMKAIGKMIRQTEKVSFSILMVMFLKALGLMIKLMDMVYMLTLMDQNTKVVC